MHTQLQSEIQRLHEYERKWGNTGEYYWLVLKVQTMKRINELNRKLLS
jgi:hypothetical protein